jgi:predicted acylesterase/phospholipase RssA
VRHLRGVRLGLALGGGGARGLAHLGVLSVLERAGISFDLMAGTSSGALMGLPYAAGWNPQQALRGFHEALMPPRLLRWSGATRRAFLAGMFRSGGWNRLLRPYFGEAKLEQLQLPLSTVAADLIGGRTVIRRQGDAIHAVLESINVPVLSRPILRDGMALVDGGIVNNVPADVLAAQGATLVVAIDVSPRLRQPYRTVGWGTIGSLLAQGNPLRTLSRVREIQAYDGTALRAQAAGLIISPDTSGFDFSDFHRAHELAAVGAAAGEELLPTLRDMLAAHER